MVARGYASLSFLHSAAEQIADRGLPAFIYHLGDYDPSGVNAGEKIEETLRELAPYADITFERIAVNPDQIAAWNLPTRPPSLRTRVRSASAMPRVLSSMRSSRDNCATWSRKRFSGICRLVSWKCWRPQRKASAPFCAI
jgi:hypothetical protein